MTKILGIDEAGRGPCIGPLVMVGFLADEEEIKKLESTKLKESKQLTSLQREEYFDVLQKIGKYVIANVSPQEIDKAVESETTNLNWLEADHTIEMIEKTKPDKVILDCPSNNPKAYKDYITQRLKHKTQIIAEHKADEKYVIVAAASIIAKVTRDKKIDEIKKRIKKNIGSGYPSDPYTKEFLRNNHDKYPEIFRHSWASCKAFSKDKKKSQKKLGEF
jgi:ribonuclease HII